MFAWAWFRENSQIEKFLARKAVVEVSKRVFKRKSYNHVSPTN